MPMRSSGAGLDPTGLVLVDEYTTAPPAVQPALLSLVLEGTIGGAKLSPRVRLFAAANPVECSASGYDIAAPAANRHIHIDWEVSATEVADYFTNGLINGASAQFASVNVLQEESRVMELWPSAMATAASKVAAFLRAHPDAKSRMPKEGDPSRGRAWASPRSWEMVIRCMASASVHSLTPIELDTLGAGCVGANNWQEFSDYLASLDLPDPAMVLDGQTQWTPDTKRLDITAAVINGCVGLVIPPNAFMREQRANALWLLLDKVGSMGARDLTHMPATTLALAKVAIATPAAMKVLMSMRKSGFQEAVK